MDKKRLNETEIRTQLITPAIGQGWDLSSQVREKYFTQGRILVRGKVVKRGSAKKSPN